MEFIIKGSKIVISPSLVARVDKNIRRSWKRTTVRTSCKIITKYILLLA